MRWFLFLCLALCKGDIVVNVSIFHVNLNVTDFPGIVSDIIEVEPLLCPAGFYCPQGCTQPIPCPPGTLRNTSGGRSALDCAPCPENNYCPSPFIQIPCPNNTFSNIGSSSRAQCYCVEGFHCIYVRQLVVVISLNVTLADFENDTNSVRTDFITGLAAAASVPVSDVVLMGVNIGKRRLLSVNATVFKSAPTVHLYKT